VFAEIRICFFVFNLINKTGCRLQKSTIFNWYDQQVYNPDVIKRFEH